MGNRIHFETTLSYASDLVPPDIVGTTTDSARYTYFFDVLSDGTVTHSQWEGPSVASHPSSAAEPYAPACDNPTLDQQLLLAIVQTDDDAFENNNSLATAAPLLPGDYRLLSANQDYYRLAAKKGDHLSVTYGQPEDPRQSLLLLNTQGDTLATLAPNQTMELAPAADQEYILAAPSLPQLDLAYDLRLEHRRSQALLLPQPLPEADNWFDGQAFYLTQPNQSAVLSAVSANGTWIKSHAFRSSNHQMAGLTTEDFGFERGYGYLRLEADDRATGLQLLVNGQGLMAGANAIDLTRKAKELFFPHVAVGDGWTTSLFVVNTGEQQESVAITPFTAAGVPLAVTTVSLERGQKLELAASSFGQTVRTVQATASSGRACLVGYVTIYNPIAFTKDRDIVTHPLAQGTTLMLPHVHSGGDWFTGIALGNPTTQTTQVRLEAYDRTGKLLDATIRSISAKGQLAFEAGQVFSSATGMAWMKAVSLSATPLCGYALYMDSDFTQLAGARFIAEAQRTLWLPHVASNAPWWTGVGLVNVSASTQEVTFRLYDRLGAQVALQRRPLAPQEHMADVIPGLFPGQSTTGGAYMEITAAEASLAGMFLLGTVDGLTLLGDTLESN